MVNDLNDPDHVELPHVLDLAVHLVHLTWRGIGGHTETFFPISTCSLEDSFLVKSYGWNEQAAMLVAHVILVSPKSLDWDLDFWTLDLGLTIALG